jgi:hypothetical protein
MLGAGITTLLLNTAMSTCAWNWDNNCNLRSESRKINHGTTADRKIERSNI